MYVLVNGMGSSVAGCVPLWLGVNKFFGFFFGGSLCGSLLFLLLTLLRMAMSASFLIEDVASVMVLSISVTVSL